MKALFGGLFPLVVGLSAVAAIPTSKARINPALLPEPVSLNVSEVLSLPSENRILVAASRSKELVAPLAEAAFDKKRDFSERWKAVVLYAQLQGPEARVFLQKCVKSSEWFMRNAALMAYQEVLPGDAATAARELLSDKALVVRSAAIGILELHPSPEVREILWNEIGQDRNFRKKQSLWTRPQILEVLSKTPDERELPLFISHLRDKDERMHPSSIRALEKLTKQKLGQGSRNLAEQKELWLKWAKSDKNTRDM